MKDFCLFIKQSVFEFIFFMFIIHRLDYQMCLIYLNEKNFHDCLMEMFLGAFTGECHCLGVIKKDFRFKKRKFCFDCCFLIDWEGVVQRSNFVILGRSFYVSKEEMSCGSINDYTFCPVKEFSNLLKRKIISNKGF